MFEKESLMQLYFLKHNIKFANCRVLLCHGDPSSTLITGVFREQLIIICTYSAAQKNRLTQRIGRLIRLSACVYSSVAQEMIHFI